MRSLVAALTSFAVLTATTLAFADDVVEMNDGSAQRGTVVKQEPGKFVVLRLPDGSQQTINWSDVRRVTVGPAAGGASSATDVDPSKRSVDAKTERDCTVDPTQSRCKETSAGHIGPDGAALGLRREEVTAVKEPTFWALNFTIDGFFTYGTSTKSNVDVSIYGGGVNAGVLALVGQTFPGKEGGSWHGARIIGGGSFYGAGVVIPNSGAGLLAYGGNVTVAYQYLRFGSIGADLKQHGIGGYIGYRIGFQNTQILAEQSTSSTDLSHGPTIGVVFPEYNAGTARIASGYINLMLLPTGDFLFFMIGGGGSF